MNKTPITSSRRLIYNTISNIITLVCNVAVGFILIRFLLGHLGEKGYGIWVLIGSIFNYKAMLTLGLNSAIDRYLPVSLAKDDYNGVQRILSTTLSFYMILAIIVLIATAVIYYNISSWFIIDEDLVTSARMLVLVVGICGFFSMPLQLFGAVLAGVQRYDLMNMGALVSLFVRVVLLVVLVLCGYGLITVGLVFGITEIMAAVIQSVSAHKLLPQSLISFKQSDFRLFREMLYYGVNAFLYATGALIICKVSDILIGILIGISEISQFAIASTGALLIVQTVQAFTVAIRPAVSDLDTRGDRPRILQISLLTQKYSLLLIIPAGFFLVCMGREFLWVWVGDKFRDPAVIDKMSTILTILVIGHCIRVAQYSNFLVLAGRGEHRLFGIFSILTALLCVLCSVISVKIYNLGLLGIAWSNLLPMALISGLILPIYYNWKMKISFMDDIKHVWYPALLGTAPAIIIMIVWKHISAPGTWFHIFAVVIVVALITLISSWFLSFTKLERKRFSGVLITKWRRNQQPATL